MDAPQFFDVRRRTTLFRDFFLFLSLLISVVFAFPSAAIPAEEILPATRQAPRVHVVKRPPATKKAIRLKSRTFAPEAGVEKGLERYFASKARRKTVHVLVQFSKMPETEQRQMLLKNKGVRLLDPLPGNAFFAAMPPQIAHARNLISTETGIEWIGPISPRDKISPALLANGVPEYALRPEGKGEFIVQFFADVPRHVQETVLFKWNGETVCHVGQLDGWRVLFDPASLNSLAKEDDVKWIVEVPPPPRLANDNVRGSGGVNADAVLLPDDPAVINPYNLTGAGVMLMQSEHVHPSTGHPDLQGRVEIGDLPLTCMERLYFYHDSGGNGILDSGDQIYIDVDDSKTVSSGDIRATTLDESHGVDSVVADGDPDLQWPLIRISGVGFIDRPMDYCFKEPEPIYEDIDHTWSISAGDRRISPYITATGITYDSGSIVGSNDEDIGKPLTMLNIYYHLHATLVAGTAVGSGANSSAMGGTPFQWKGVAPGASLRAYRPDILNDSIYPDASSHGVIISTNSWSDKSCHEVDPLHPELTYNPDCEFSDGIVSGCTSSGGPGSVRRILIVHAAGNSKRPERYVDSNQNKYYDNGESIFFDQSDIGTVLPEAPPLLGPSQSEGVILSNFAPEELHSEKNDFNGRFESSESIYRDNDGSMSVSVGDTRISSPEGLPIDAPVTSGDVDIGTSLRQFNLWGNIDFPSSAKNVLAIGNIRTPIPKLFQESSQGPTPDGRLKPDLVTPGLQITTTCPPDRYSLMTGTSISCPAAAGAAALVTEWFNQTCSSGFPTPDLLRALLIHGADDLSEISAVEGVFTGPDYAYGYGRVNVKNSVNLIPHHFKAAVTSETMEVNTFLSIPVGVASASPLKVTLVWDDPPWTANASPSPEHGILQNDLDLLLIGPDGTQYTPWELNPANPFVPASQRVTPAGITVPEEARDHRNTIEQVYVPNASSGTWRIRVSTSRLAMPRQEFVLVSESLPIYNSACSRITLDFNGLPGSDNVMETSDDVPFTSNDILYCGGPDGYGARIIDDEYASLGVHFSGAAAIGAIGGGFNPDGTLGPGSNLLLDSIVISDEVTGAISGIAPFAIQFDNQQTAISFDLFGYINCSGTSIPVTLKDEAGNEALSLELTGNDALFTVSGLGPLGGRYQIVSPVPFKSVEFGLTDCGGGYGIDNLNYGFVPHL